MPWGYIADPFVISKIQLKFSNKRNVNIILTLPWIALCTKYGDMV